MKAMFVLVSLIAMQFAGAQLPPQLNLTSTTPAGVSCDTPLCKGLVGAGVGVAGLAAIGGIVGGIVGIQHHAGGGGGGGGGVTLGPAPSPAPGPVPPGPAPGPSPGPAPTEAPGTPATTLPGGGQSPGGVSTSLQPRESDDEMRMRLEDEDGSNWLVPLLVGLLLLCCFLAVVLYFCTKKGKKPTTKKKPSVRADKREAPALDMAEPLAQTPDIAPLLGHWEQPKQLVPVTTAQSSYVPQLTAATYAPSYAMAPAVMSTGTVASTGVIGMGGYSTGGIAGGYSMPGVATSGIVPGSLV